MKLNQYLNKISQGDSINLARFIKCLPFSDMNEWRKIYSATRVRDGHQMEVLDEERHSALFEPEVSDRVGSSHLGRSHAFPSSFAHVLVLNSTTKSQVPFVVISDANGYKTQGKLIGQRAVLIENIENFYRYREFLELIGHPLLAENSDIIFGSGNQICHHLNTPFLSIYDEIYCAQDVELGGLTIFNTLKASFPQCVWLAPIEWEPFRSKFKLKPKNGTNLAKAIMLARDLGLNEEADLMNQTRHFMEQEAFLPVFKKD
ncbi:hypothetical protein BIT28_08770 [Photobacterium proteolyticum]|uniref:Wadjet protein JetD C-terminal domain-containing protein n=1 Tax=Photobacterium proteolyticum TaxID=1903952 RepID=A0A1Q9GIH6_9GAMM|nr:hypothetical protein [Photobacterium proteolyticum]OLQ74262.1 hypothetical protein BIT28_08770 [Photobacterium proteolyticum]